MLSTLAFSIYGEAKDVLQTESKRKERTLPLALSTKNTLQTYCLL